MHHLSRRFARFSPSLAALLLPKFGYKETRLCGAAPQKPGLSSCAVTLASGGTTLQKCSRVWYTTYKHAQGCDPLRHVCVRLKPLSLLLFGGQTVEQGDGGFAISTDYYILVSFRSQGLSDAENDRDQGTKIGDRFICPPLAFWRAGGTSSRPHSSRPFVCKYP